MYSDDDLKRLRCNFLRDCRPKEYRRLKKAGELDEHLQKMADLCSRRAVRLVENGTTFEEQAWHWAVREVLLETKWD